MTDPDPGPDEIGYPVGVNTRQQQASGATERVRLMELLDRQAGTLWSMALFFFDDLDNAEPVVAELLVEAAVEPYTMSHADIHRDLSRRMYLTSRRLSKRRVPPAVSARHEGAAAGSVADVLLTALTRQERSAFALCWLGEHSYQEAAELMSLPARDVLNTLWTGLQALEHLGQSLTAVSRSSPANVEETALPTPVMGGWQ